MLKIKKFMLLEDIVYDFKDDDLSVIIGENGTGKSLILKLVYFFELSKSIIIDAIMDKSNWKDNLKKIDCNKILKKKFHEIFNSLDINDKFEVDYTLSGELSGTIHIRNTSNSVTVYMDDILWKNIRKTDTGYIKKYNKQFNIVTERISEKFKPRIISGDFKLVEYELEEKVIFIPTGKFTYSIIENYIYSFLESKENSYDYFLKDFGKIRLSFRRKFVNEDQDTLLLKFFTSDNDVKNFSKEKKLQKIIFSILKGNLLKDKDNETLKIKNKRGGIVNINNASSGQQEILPLLFVIYFEAINNKYESKKQITFLIEEPESHLHPKSQKELVEFLDAIYQYGEGKIKFIINTHSPYILEVVNYTFLKNKQITDSKGIKNCSIFELVGGKLKNLVTQDGYISTNEMSKVSDQIENDLFSIDIN